MPRTDSELRWIRNLGDFVKKILPHSEFVTFPFDRSGCFVFRSVETNFWFPVLFWNCQRCSVKWTKMPLFVVNCGMMFSMTWPLSCRMKYFNFETIFNPIPSHKMSALKIFKFTITRLHVQDQAILLLDDTTKLAQAIFILATSKVSLKADEMT